MAASGFPDRKSSGAGGMTSPQGSVLDGPPPSPAMAQADPTLQPGQPQDQPSQSQDQSSFLFQDQQGHLYERDFDNEAELIEFIQSLSDDS